jgi:RimJ/RimL family protein N-acetyltransferase
VSLNGVQGHLRASIAGRAHRIGPFLITYEPDTVTPGRNYAIPDDISSKKGATPDAADVAELVAYFAMLDRTPRLEYVGPAAGGGTALDAVLLAAGFVVENRYPLMIINPDDLIEPPLPAGVEVRLATTDAQLWQVARVQNGAYGEGPPTEHDVARLRRTVRGDGAVALAVLHGGGADDVPVGAGLFTAPAGGLTEIAAVGVVEEYRRRGIAAAIAYRLTRAALDAGAIPYLQAEGEAEQRIYGRLGYRTIGALTAISRPALFRSAETIVSERLVLRPLTAAEAARIATGDISGWTAGDGWPHDDTRDGLALVASGALGWLVTLDGVVIGDCGTTGPVGADGAVEIGYGLAGPYRGRGYGGEMVRELSHWLLRQPGVRDVVATVDAGNTPSRRALHRAGFRAQPADRDDQQIRYALDRPAGHHPAHPDILPEQVDGGLGH